VSFVDLVIAAKERETNTYSSLFLAISTYGIGHRMIKKNRPREREKKSMMMMMSCSQNICLYKYTQRRRKSGGSIVTFFCAGVVLYGLY